MVKIASKQKVYAGHRFYAEIWKNGERVGWGYNHPGESDLSRTYAKHDLAEGTHAEVAAIVSAMSRWASVKDSTLLIARAKKNKRGGVFVQGTAIPCAGCTKIIMDMGVGEMFYTLDSDAYNFLHDFDPLSLDDINNAP